MTVKQWIVAFSSLVLVSSLFLLNWQVDRTQFGFLMLCYSGAFIGYFLLLANRNWISFKQFVLIAIACQVAAVFFQPHLSIDYYRFLWDGEITWMGYNPFDFKPAELAQKGIIENSNKSMQVISFLYTNRSYNFYHQFQPKFYHK